MIEFLSVKLPKEERQFEEHNNTFYKLKLPIKLKIHFYTKINFVVLY